MKDKVIKVVKKICFAFVMLYGLNFILGSINIFIPINIFTLALVSFLGAPALMGLVAIFFLI